MSILSTSLDFIFGPLLELPTLIAVLILSIVISLLITLIYKYATNQELMKQLKNEIKELQNEAKQLKDQPDKAMHVQKQAMETNMKYMMQSFKPTLITFIPIILIFGWMSSHFAYEPILPNQEFTTTVLFEKGVNETITIETDKEITLTSKPQQTITNGQAIFGMKGTEGLHTATFTIKEKKYAKNILITDKNRYEPPELAVNDGIITTITTNHAEKIVLNLFGWKLGWLGTYIIFSIISSMLLRKWLNVY